MSDPKKKDTSFEDLLRDAKAAIGEVDNERKALKDAHNASAIGQISKQVTAIHKTFNQVSQAGMWVYNNIIDPVVSSGVIGWPFRTYGKLWNWAVYKEDAEGERIFSKRNAGLMLCATLAAGLNVGPIMTNTAELAWDTAWMATTTRTETWYLGQSQEIYPDSNIFSTRGCESITCSDQDSIYFRIKPSIAHNIRSLVQDGSFFYSDFVAAAIPNDTNSCEVTYYGTRAKTFVRGFDIYPQILNVECSPLSVNGGALQAPQQPAPAMP
ncbi:MAG: hypothetical protein VXW91_00840 [Pseudomonadota bacterium]|nr:hypothetical protein [Pseudomonadota bacterium]MEC8664105.1 hypothetical protein [Pseudomonadota bacterium]